MSAEAQGDCGATADTSEVRSILDVGMTMIESCLLGADECASAGGAIAEGSDQMGINTYDLSLDGPSIGDPLWFGLTWYADQPVETGDVSSEEYLLVMPEFAIDFAGVDQIGPSVLMTMPQQSSGRQAIGFIDIERELLIGGALIDDVSVIIDGQVLPACENAGALADSAPCTHPWEERADGDYGVIIEAMGAGVVTIGVPAP